MKVTMKDGLVLEGTPQQIAETMTKLGISGSTLFYNSGTHGLILIQNMETYHLRNAIVKMYREWVEELRSISEPKMFVNKIVDGITDPTWIAMVEELSKRGK